VLGFEYHAQGIIVIEKAAKFDPAHGIILQQNEISLPTGADLSTSLPSRSIL